MRRTKNSNNDLKNNKFGRLMLSDFNTYYRATVIKTGWHLCKERNTNNTTDSRNRHIHREYKTIFIIVAKRMD